MPSVLGRIFPGELPGGARPESGCPPSALEPARSSARPWGPRASPELCLTCHRPQPPPAFPVRGSTSPRFQQPRSDFTCGWRLPRASLGPSAADPIQAQSRGAWEEPWCLGVLLSILGPRPQLGHHFPGEAGQAGVPRLPQLPASGSSLCTRGRPGASCRLSLSVAKSPGPDLLLPNEMRKQTDHWVGAEVSSVPRGAELDSWLLLLTHGVACLAHPLQGSRNPGLAEARPPGDPWLPPSPEHRLSQHSWPASGGTHSLDWTKDGTKHNRREWLCRRPCGGPARNPLGEQVLWAEGPAHARAPGGGGRVLRSKMQPGRSRPDGAARGSRVYCVGSGYSMGPEEKPRRRLELRDGGYHLTWGSRSYYHPLGG